MAKVAVVMLASVVLALVSVSCFEDPPSDHSFLVSSHGHRVRFIDYGTISSGRATLQEIHDRLAYELSICAFYQWQYDVCYDIVDAHSFVVGDVWACGQYLPGTKTVKVCWYSQATGTEAPPDAPAWTVRPSWRDPSIMVWGVVPKYLPALEHELGHYVYGPLYGH